MRGRDDDHRIDVAVGDQIVGRTIGLGHVELLGDAGGKRAIGVGDGHHGRFGNPRRQIADVDLAEPAQADDATSTCSRVRCHSIEHSV